MQTPSRALVRKTNNSRNSIIRQDRAVVCRADYDSAGDRLDVY
jgi:hypothetical protein